MTQPQLRIEGRGPVAMALRLFLARQGFAADTVRTEPVVMALPGWLASRPLALSLGSWQLLSRIVELPETAPIRTVEVSLARHSGRTCIRAGDIGAATLGCVSRYGALHRSLAHALTRLYEGRNADGAGSSDSEHVASSDDERALVVVADGETRAGTARDPDWRVHDFGQSALLTEVLADGAADGVAFERFTADGPLALLPLPERHRRAVVWCATAAQTARRTSLADEAFEDELLAAFGPALGRLRLDAARHAMPLQRKLASPERDPRRVAIGNAAQSLHPVAGQGLNLGLRDAFELARCLGEARGRGRPLDEVVAQFRRSRLVDRAAVVAITDTLARVFTLRGLAPLQSIALGALDVAAPLRNGFAGALMFGVR